MIKDTDDNIGIELDNAKYSNCNNNKITGDIHDGIKIDSGSTFVNVGDNTIFSASQFGIWCRTDSNIISDNLVDGDSGDSDAGIYLDSSENCSINTNIFDGCVIGVDEVNTCDYNMYIGNNALGCTNGYDINGANYKPTGQTNFTNLNFGTWT